jgi:hypothetical protein
MYEYFVSPPLGQQRKYAFEAEHTQHMQNVLQGTVQNRKKWVSTLINSVEASYFCICNSVRTLFTDGELFYLIKISKAIVPSLYVFLTVQLHISLFSWLLFFPRVKMWRECSLPSHGDKLISKSCLLPWSHIQYCTLQAVSHRPTYSSYLHGSRQGFTCTSSLNCGQSDVSSRPLSPIRRFLLFTWDHFFSLNNRHFRKRH